MHPGQRSPDRSSLRTRTLVIALAWAAAVAGHADVLVGLNGERLVGRIIEENADQVVFESEIAGRVTIPRVKLVEIQRTAPRSAATTPTISPTPAPVKPVEIATPQTGTNVLSRPLTVGRDGFDWLQLKSGEWLKGRLEYFRDNKIRFDSEELDDQLFDEDDVPQFHTGRPMFVKPDGQEAIYGTVSATNGVVAVNGLEPVVIRRNQVAGITPGGDREISFWSGKANAGVNFQAGNTRQVTFNASAELARRSPYNTLLLNYTGNIGEVDEVETANNHRISGTFDIHLSRRLFLRTPFLEYYRDPLANIDLRATAAVGVGYRIFDSDKLEWLVAAGPGYQYIRYETGEAGESDHNSTPAAVLQTEFKAEITKRLDFIVSDMGTLSSHESGLYTHHGSSTLEFEIKKHLDLNVSFVWDYLHEPQPDASGAIPLRSDYRLILWLGVKF